MRKLYLFAAFLVIYEFTTYIANDMIMPGMLHVVSDFHAPISYVSLSLSLYLLGNSALQLFLGPLSERFGNRKIILVGNVMFIIFTIFIMLAQNIHMFLLGRLLQGSGIGFIAMGYALIHQIFDDKQAVKIFALMANVSLLAPLLGPLFGVMMLEVFSWRYIFVIIGVLAIIALFGLRKFTPSSTPKTTNMSLPTILKTYWKILNTKQFILGTLCTTIAAMPILCWIGLAPTIIMKTLGKSMLDYGIYQLFAIGGLSLSSILMQFIAGKFSFYRLIKTTSLLAFAGLLIGVICHTNIDIVVLGMFLYSFGLGIFNNLIMRLVMTVPDLPQSMITSLMVFIQTIIFAIGIEIVNHISEYFNYSLYSFTIACFIFACIFLVMTRSFARQNKAKQWE